MKKLLLVVIILLLAGCDKKIVNLSDKYYNNGDYISVTNSELSDTETYLLYTYNNFCNLPIHCENIFKETMEKYKIDILSMPFDEFKNTTFHNKVKYAPSVLIISNGKLLAYLDANSDRDYEKYQNTEEFETWLQKYINLIKTTN